MLPVIGVALSLKATDEWAFRRYVSITVILIACFAHNPPQDRVTKIHSLAIVDPSLFFAAIRLREAGSTRSMVETISCPLSVRNSLVISTSGKVLPPTFLSPRVKKQKHLVLVWN